MVELRAYREQHTSLAELVGSTGVLQETLYRQKQELLHKFKVTNHWGKERGKDDWDFWISDLVKNLYGTDI